MDEGMKIVIAGLVCSNWVSGNIGGTLGDLDSPVLTMIGFVTQLLDDSQVSTHSVDPINIQT